MKCEGYRKYGGVFSLGPITWKQCENDAVVMVEVEQDGKCEILPSCMVCWQEAIDTGMTILSVRPIISESKKGGE